MSMRYIFCLLVFLFCAPMNVLAETHVGYRSFSTWNSRENVRLDVGVWYPAYSQERDYVMDEYHVFVAKNARVQKIIDEDTAGPFLEEQEKIREAAKKNNIPKSELAKQLEAVPVPYKKYPLLIISHASGSTRFSNHTLADLLVKQGYIVAVPNHSEDNSHDMRNFYTAKSLYQRARQCSLAVDLLLTDKSISSFIDSSKISFLGFGSGGTAGLLLAGGELTEKKWLTYCSDYDGGTESEAAQNLWIFDVRNEDENVFCKEPVKSQMQDFALGLQMTNEIGYLENLFFYNAIDSKNALLEKVHAAQNSQIRWSKRSNPGLAAYIYEPPFLTPYLPPLPTQYTYIDTRFKNFIFVSPGLTMFFDIAAVKNRELSFCIVGLEKDYFNKAKFQAQALHGELGAERAEYHSIAGADLWSTQAPCYGSNVLVEICKSVSDEQREQVLAKLFKIVKNFLPAFE